MTTDMKKLARLADIFLDAADFPLSSNAAKLGKRVENALDANEKKEMNDHLFAALIKKSQGDENIGAETLALADLFCRAAARLGVEQQAARLIPLDYTDRKTETELRLAGYSHLAHTVKAARSS